MIFYISSTKNEKYKLFKSLKQKKARTSTGLYVVEGIKSVGDAVFANAQIEAILISDILYEKEKPEFGEGTDVYVIDDKIFPPLTDTENPQGIIAVIKQNNNNTDELDVNNAYIYCDCVQDPGNLGTIIRTADAAGFGGVLLSPGCVDLYNPKTVRASMGSFFHIVKNEAVCVANLEAYKKAGFKIVCAVLSDNTVDYINADFKQPVIIVIGNEANGICDEVLKISDIDVKIPIVGRAESLNAAVAASVLMYEVNRQRRS